MAQREEAGADGAQPQPQEGVKAPPPRPPPPRQLRLLSSLPVPSHGPSCQVGVPPTPQPCSSPEPLFPCLRCPPPPDCLRTLGDEFHQKGNYIG